MTPAAEVVTLTPMRRRHLRAVLRIEAASQPRGWSLGLFLGELRRPEGRSYLVAKVGGDVVGFGGMLFVGDQGHLATLAVHPDVRRQHIGTRLTAALCRAAIDHGATSLTLEVRAGNHAAQALYRRFGFAPAGIRRDYYREGPGPAEDALVMWVHDVDAASYDERLGAIEAPLAETTRIVGMAASEPAGADLGGRR
jgi:ribosomal-protein-alanine N-acetyltransferase